MRTWQRLIFGLLALAAIGAALWLWDYEPEILEGSIVTREGIVVDRAMSDGLPYISVALADGSSVCCWELHEDAVVPEEINPGAYVRITYGVEKDHGRYAVLKVEN